MENLIKSLHKKIYVKQAGTGTIYVQFNGKKIRISNHEPNEAMRRLRGKADLELYTHDIVGKEINSKYDIVEKIADYFDLPITGSTHRINPYLRGLNIQHTITNTYFNGLEQQE